MLLLNCGELGSFAALAAHAASEALEKVHGKSRVIQ
jgi:hypothetical protein